MEWGFHKGRDFVSFFTSGSATSRTAPTIIEMNELVLSGLHWVMGGKQIPLFKARVCKLFESHPIPVCSTPSEPWRFPPPELALKILIAGSSGLDYLSGAFLE